MILVILPTYNEADNVRTLIPALLELREDVAVLVVDDHSPDETWRVAGEMAEADERIHLLHRTHEKGRGSAGLDGFLSARQFSPTWIIEMDADWSHPPRFLPSLIEAAEKQNADMVIGSRLVPGGGEAERSAGRTFITRLANVYLRALFGWEIQDHTSGYRLYRGELMAQLPFERMRAQGPSVLQETLLAVKRAGGKIIESPIIYEPRRAGESTFNAKIALKGLTDALRVRFGPRPEKRKRSRPTNPWDA